jgi:dTDP-4-dehydrorhamnose reductase|tara:strand:- start:1954 stop:2862 length:909 start_codon:yes stop_codon:yes gene_type:complete
MKILITGSNGLLGQKLVKLCLQKSIKFIATSSGPNRNPDCPEENYISLDITSAEQIQHVLVSTMPSAIIHTAAMTNVDECEQKPKECHQVNVMGTAYLFAVAQKINAHFQLLSTDFVFDGEKGNYDEVDSVSPLSVYAKSKVDAERLLQLSKYTKWSIARTIIVYGTGHNLSRSNIVLWAREALAKGEPLKIVDDQFRAPTWADDLAKGCMSIVENKHFGIFHLCGPKTYSILDLVKTIAEYYGFSTNNISPVSSSTLNQAAKRPPRTGFNLTKAETLLNYKPIGIEESLSLLDKEIEILNQ